MARKNRVHYEGALYHVICRGNNKNYIFEENDEKEKYIQTIRKYKERYNFKLYAYCIMGNHVHMLMEVSDTPLSKVMQGIQQVYTYYYNKKYDRSGHVFEQRYKAILCSKDEYLLALIRYIHQNPVRSGLEGGLNYKYSSHNSYIHHNYYDLIDKEFPLSLFSSNLINQINEYNKFVGENDNIISGLEEKGLTIEIVENTKEKEDENKYPISIIIKNVCNYYNINQQEINIKERTRRLVNARKVIAYMGKKYSNVSNKELSKLLNLAESSVSNIIADKVTAEEVRNDILEIYKIIKA